MNNNNFVNCRCCDPPQKFYDYSGRSKHKKSRMKKDCALTSKNLKQIPDANPSKTKSAYDTRSNASSQYSRASRISKRDKAKEFAELVNTAAPCIQLNKKNTINPITESISAIINEYHDNPIVDIDAMKRKLSFYNALKNYNEDDDINSKIQTYCDQQLEINSEETNKHSQFLISLRDDLKEKINYIKQTPKLKSLFQNEHDFVKNLRLKDQETGEYKRSTQMITQELYELETFEQPFLAFKIEQIKAEISQRKRKIDKDFYQLLSEAIAPVYETTAQFSQNDWDIDLPEVSSAKKLKK